MAWSYPAAPAAPPTSTPRYDILCGFRRVGHRGNISFAHVGGQTWRFATATFSSCEASSTTIPSHAAISTTLHYHVHLQMLVNPNDMNPNGTGISNTNNGNPLDESKYNQM